MRNILQVIGTVAAIITIIQAIAWVIRTILAHL